MISRGKNFIDFPEVIQTTEITTKIYEIFLFPVRDRGPIAASIAPSLILRWFPSPRAFPRLGGYFYADAFCVNFVYDGFNNIYFVARMKVYTRASCLSVVFS